MRTQQVQPSFIMQDMHSQQAWIISEHFGSPLVQVMVTPSLVMSHLHMPMVMLQQQTTMPFMRQQQEHMPPASMVHRFWTMLAPTLSSQEQWIFMPPWHFSSLRVQRGTIIVVAGIAAGAPIVGVLMPGMLIPGIPNPVRSIIMVAILASFTLAWAIREADIPSKPDHRASRRKAEL
jgi:hypothetical protein